MPKGSRKSQKAQAKPAKNDLVTKTVSLPRPMFEALIPVLELDPEGANLSRYIRNLIRKDLNNPNRELLRA